MGNKGLSGGSHGPPLLEACSAEDGGEKEGGAWADRKTVAFPARRATATFVMENRLLPPLAWVEMSPPLITGL